MVSLITTTLGAPETVGRLDGTAGQQWDTKRSEETGGYLAALGAHAIFRCLGRTLGGMNVVPRASG